MPGHHYTPGEFALQRVVEFFGDLLFQSEEHHSTHTYQMVSRFCQLEGIHYLVLRYFNTMALTFEGFLEEWSLDGEA
jgi:hypothetical protein